jgi:ABC-2 type transport system ATP-binding protein
MRILTTQLRPTSGEPGVGPECRPRGHQSPKDHRPRSPEDERLDRPFRLEDLLIYAKIYGVARAERPNLLAGVLEKMGMKAAAWQVVRTCSGGMIRRLKLASVLLIRPKTLFLGEPAIGLDPSARKAVWTELRKFKEGHGITIFFDTHYMDEADLCAEEIGIINQGKRGSRPLARPPSSSSPWAGRPSPLSLSPNVISPSG